MKLSLKILIGYHKKDILFKDEIFTPIHLGRSAARSNMNKDDLNWMLENMVGDDTGDNISNENSYYNELTGVYWAWKNYEQLGNPEYIGFMHYRRHFVFRTMPDVIDTEINTIDENYYNLINYSEDAICNYLQSNHIIIHRGIVDSIYKQYSDNQDISELDDVLQIIDQNAPKYSKTAHKYMKQSRGSFYNMFILPKHIFFDYCEWLFGILKIYVSSHDMIKKRLFVSERLSGIYFQYLIDNGIKYYDFPIVLLKNTISVPIVIPWEDNLFKLSVLLVSHTQERSKSTKLSFYIVGNLSETNKEILHKLSLDFDFFIEFIELSEKDKVFSGKNCVLILPRLLSKISKVIFATTRVLCNKDCSEFYRTANTDDRWVLAVSNEKNSVQKWTCDLMVLNLNYLRSEFKDIHDVNCTEPYSVEKLFSQIWGDHIGMLPDWMFTEAETGSRGELFDFDDTRGDCQYKAGWTNYLYYNTYDPQCTVQGIYSLAWWNVASMIPGYVCKEPLDIGAQWCKLVEQQSSINKQYKDVVNEKNSHKFEIFKKIKKIVK